MQMLKIDSTELLPAAWCYNPSIIQYKKKLLFAYRRVYKIDQNDWKMYSRVCICELDKSLAPKGKHTELQFKPIFANSLNHQEDPRLFLYKDELYCSYINSTHDYGSPSQGLCKLNDKYEVVENWFIDYGNNINGSVVPIVDTICLRPGVFCSAPPSKISNGVEKNWVFFQVGDKLNAIYETNPLQVIEIDLSSSKGKLLSKSSTKLDWQWGKLSGGTSPILMNGEYHTFFHSFYNNEEYKRRVYTAGYMAFDKNYQIKRISKTPILHADKTCFETSINHSVVFPGGVLYKDGKWTIAYGVDDQHCNLAIVDDEEVQTNCQIFI